MTLQHLFVFAAPGLSMFIYLFIVFRLTHRRIVIPVQPEKPVSIMEKFWEQLDDDEVVYEDEEEDDDDTFFEVDEWEKRNVYLIQDDLMLYQLSWFFCEMFFLLDFLLFPFLPNTAINAFAAPYINAVLASINQANPDLLTLIISVIVMVFFYLILMTPFFRIFIRLPIEYAFSEIWRYIDCGLEALVKDIPVFMGRLYNNTVIPLSKRISNKIGKKWLPSIWLITLLIGVAVVNIFVVNAIFMGVSK